MNIAKYLDQMKNIQDNFLSFLENGENAEDTFNNLNIGDEHDFKLFLHFISSIFDNYYHGPTFFAKSSLRCSISRTTSKSIIQIQKFSMFSSRTSESFSFSLKKKS